MINKFNRGFYTSTPTPTPSPVYLTYDGKHFWCGDKILDIVTSKKLVRVNNKYKTGLEVNGKPYRMGTTRGDTHRRLVFINKNKLITHYGASFKCTDICKQVFDGQEDENWEPFKE